MTVSLLWLFLAVTWVGLQFVIVEFSDHTHLANFCAKLLQAVSPNERNMLNGMEHVICDVIICH